MDQLISLFLKNALKPMFINQEIFEIEKSLTRSEIIALLMLRQRNESTMSQLASDLGIPVSTVTNISQRLIKRGLIERNQDPNDKRVILVTLTKDGETIAIRVLNVIKSILQRVEDALTPEELQQFIPLILKVANALQSSTNSINQKKETSRKIQIEE
ncbi:MarR family winged helix-turn-helix transcriptional regulator [Gottfriedia acidiceleris]|uniref:MarR family transcriptional regulator n=1 Tax=Gottfriedia acidiceleris TaxID=371036 RepID=A0ABY4JQM4_9BACI|nr:MarR family transcriptional regulator [Gottfriedia acidiceleris]UPM56128.1 MarR family transcriptional regulator [Gottfriedia acidiceleris]